MFQHYALSSYALTCALLNAVANVAVELVLSRVVDDARVEVRAWILVCVSVSKRVLVSVSVSVSVVAL